jgi:hypothetical protein
MGIGYENATGPQKCFNGQKLWAFNWFPKNKKIVDPIADGEWRGNLIAFVDVGLTQAPVVLRVGDLYLVYNRAKKYNYQVNEMADMVTVVKAPTSTSESSLRAGINGSPGRNSFSILSKFPDGSHRITIDVCKVGKEGTIDYADLSIRREGTRSSCGILISRPNLSKSRSVTCKSDTDCPGIKERCLLTSEGKICLKLKNAKISTHALNRLKTIKTPTSSNAANLSKRRKFSMAPTRSKVTKAPINSKVTKSPMRRKLTSHQ